MHLVVYGLNWHKSGFRDTVTERNKREESKKVLSAADKNFKNNRNPLRKLFFQLILFIHLPLPLLLSISNLYFSIFLTHTHTRTINHSIWKKNGGLCCTPWENGQRTQVPHLVISPSTCIHSYIRAHVCIFDSIKGSWICNF